jgi:hypothetical protein
MGTGVAFEVLTGQVLGPCGTVRPSPDCSFAWETEPVSSIIIAANFGTFGNSCLTVPKMEHYNRL